MPLQQMQQLHDLVKPRLEALLPAADTALRNALLNKGFVLSNSTKSPIGSADENWAHLLYFYSGVDPATGVEFDVSIVLELFHAASSISGTAYFQACREQFRITKSVLGFGSWPADASEASQLQAIDRLFQQIASRLGGRPPLYFAHRLSEHFSS